MAHCRKSLFDTCRHYLENGFGIPYVVDGKLYDIETVAQLSIVMKPMDDRYSVYEIDCSLASELFKSLPFNEFDDLYFLEVRSSEPGTKVWQFGIWM